ncbi:MAG TPA: TetR/AcrR family transcriptional regulator [Alphaproteobacteria bacterium]|jgi:AcrR family transcriptional regulator|nr:TetR/AcrR family transcriptional regulator [Alphaproteobacteria bacterium]
MSTAELTKTATVKRLRPNPRGRLGGRRTRQEQQKADSRIRILDAVKTVLETQPYALLAVEDVIAEAQVSRTTFYRHFDSKFAIFRELYQPFSEALYRVYDELARYPDPTVAQMCDWVNLFLDFYRSQKILVQAFQHIYAIEPDFYPIAETAIDTISRRLADRLPAFRQLLSDDAAAMDAKIEGHFLLQDINYFGHEVVSRQWGLDTSKATLILATRIRDFIRAYRA